MLFCSILILICAHQICGQSSSLGGMGLIGDAIEGYRPCDSGVLSMERIIGGRPRTENYWDGQMYFDDWPNLPEIHASLTVDNPATIELNEDDGRVLVTNRTFHISTYDHPPVLKVLKFTVRGIPFGAFPNVERLTLNGLDVCQNPRKWKPTLLGTSGNAGETQEDKPEAPKCGKRLVQHEPLITNGFPSKEGDWPWHTAVFHLILLQQEYRCGGTLINANTVLTGMMTSESESVVIDFDKQVFINRCVLIKLILKFLHPNRLQLLTASTNPIVQLLPNVLSFIWESIIDCWLRRTHKNLR